VRFLTLAGAEKLDPDLLFLERGLPAYAEVRAQAKSAIAFAAHATLPNPQSASPEERSRAAQSLAELIAASSSEATRANLLREAAGHLSLLPRVMQQEFETVENRLRRQSAARPEAAPPPSAAATARASVTPEHELLMLCLHFEHVGKPLSHAIQHDWIDTSEGHLAGRLLNRFLAEFEHDSWPGRDQLESVLESPEERALVASLLFESPEIDDPFKVAQEGLRQLRTRRLEPRLRQIELALANPHADIESDPISLLKERSELQRLLRQPIVLTAVV
jgi:DNA primase